VSAFSFLKRENLVVVKEGKVYYNLLKRDKRNWGRWVYENI